MGAISTKYNVEIDGQGYTLARQPRTNRDVYKRSEAPSFVNKFGSGDPAYRDSTFWSHWVQINWQNGNRSEFFNDQARFIYNENINIQEEGRITLGAKAETSTNIVSAQVCALARYSGTTGTDDRLFMGDGKGQIFEWDGTNSWTSFYTVGNPPITTMATNEGYLYVGTGIGSAGTSIASAYKLSSNGTLSTSGVVGVSNPLDAGINVMLVDSFYNGAAATWQGVLNSNYTTYIGTTGYTAFGGLVQAGGYGAAFSAYTGIINHRGAKITDLIKYQGQLVVAGGYPIGSVTTLSDGSISVYNGVDTTELVSLKHTVPLTLAVFDNLLFVGTIHGHLYVYNGSSFDLLFKFWGNDIDMKIEKLWVHQDKLHIAVTSMSTLKNSNVKYAGVYTFNRRGISLDYKIDDSFSYVYKNLITYKNQLFFSVSPSALTSPDNDVTWRTNENLFNVSGSLQSSYFDANLPSIDKLFKEVTLVYDYLSASTSATIGFKSFETESFTTLGTIQTEGSTSATFQFPSATAKKQLSYQISLSTGAVSSTPRIKKIINKYTVQPDFYHQWDFAIDTSEKVQLLDGTFHPSSGLQLESALFTSKRLKQVVTYKDVDYVSTTLNGAIAASATIINGADFSRFPPKGRLRIPSTGEEIIYASRTSTTINTVTRSYKNTVAVSAANAASIDMSYQAMFKTFDEEQFSLNQLSDQFNHITPIGLLET